MKMRILLSAILFSAVYGQQIGTEWIDVIGKSDEEIKKIIRENIGKIKTYKKNIIDQEEEKLTVENEDRKYEFNTVKINLRAALDEATTAKQLGEINLIKVKDISNETRSLLKAQLQIISDADSSISSNKKVIEEKKKEVEEELTKLPFQVVILSITRGYDGSNVKMIDAAMEYQIAKKAIESELGTRVVSSSIIDNGILSEKRVKTLLSGKVNSRLESDELENEQEDGSLLFDRVRYGLTTVYPFEADENSLLKSPVSSGEYAIDTYISNSSEGKKIAGDIDITRKIRSLEQEANSKNIESKGIIKRLGAETKSFIEDRQKEIKKAERNKENAVEKIEEYKIQLTDLSADSLSKGSEMENSAANFNKVKQDYTNHIFSENYVYSETRFTDRMENVNMDEQYISSAEKLFDLFLASVNSQIVQDESEISDEQYSEFSGTKKDKVSVNSIRILGKIFIPKRKSSTGKPNLGVSLAFDYGFTFKEADISKISYAKSSIKKPLPGQRDNVSISSNPVGAEVFLSGRKIGVTPFTYYLNPDHPNGIVLKKKGFEDQADVIHIRRRRMVSKNYELKEAKKGSGMSKWLVYSVLGGGVVYAAITLAGESAGEEPAETGSMTITIILPN